jgi:hypothetical protein
VTSHEAGHRETGHHAAGPSRPGSVVLDIGPGTGALVLYTPASLEGAEIEISLADVADARRTHSQVRRRLVGPAVFDTQPAGSASVTFAAVYPALPSGRYTIWREADTPAGVLTIADGEVTEWHWPVPVAGLGEA